MTDKPTATVRMYGCLLDIRKERGLPIIVEMPLPPEGRPAREIALELELPLTRIEGVFINHVVFSIDEIVRPGDRIAFVPTGVPGPHRFMLGIHRAGKGAGAR